MLKPLWMASCMTKTLSSFMREKENRTINQQKMVMINYFAFLIQQIWSINCCPYVLFQSTEWKNKPLQFNLMSFTIP